MKLVVGLGNPGLEYRNTWHNAGVHAVKELKRLQKKGKLPRSVILRGSDVFMNTSGSFVADLVKKYDIKLQDLYIIHDDLDIRLGSDSKIQFGRGPKDHNGLKSVDEALGSDQYWHVRIGVDDRPEDNRPMGEEYVLQNYSDKERQILGDSIKLVCKKLAILLKNTN